MGKKLCELCKLNEANKTGSHLVPHFLLKRIVNVDGKTGRDKELAFTLSGINVSSYFGNAVLPEKLEEIYGDELEKAIERNVNSDVADYVLCTVCEDKLGYKENKYAQTLKRRDAIEYKSCISGQNGILFWCSVFWRMSVLGNYGVKFSKEQNETLRSVLDAYLPSKSISSTQQNKSIEIESLLKKISYKILRCHNCDMNEAKWLLLHPEFYNLMCLFIDEFIVVLSLDGDFKELEDLDCFGLNQLILEAPTNSVVSDEIIKPFDKSIYNHIIKSFVDLQVQLMMSELNDLLDNIHIKLGGIGKEMPLHIKREIILELINNSFNLGNKFSQSELASVIFTVLNKYQQE